MRRTNLFDFSQYCIVCTLYLTFHNIVLSVHCIWLFTILYCLYTVFDFSQYCIVCTLYLTLVKYSVQTIQYCEKSNTVYRQYNIVKSQITIHKTLMREFVLFVITSQVITLKLIVLFILCDSFAAFWYFMCGVFLYT
jgi:hypothetical protein